jgi:hypothetical protein
MKSIIGLGDDETPVDATQEIRSANSAVDQSGLYPIATALRPAFEQRRRDLFEVVGLTQAQIAEREADHVSMIAEMGLPPFGVGQLLFDASVSADVAERRRPDEEVDVQAWNEETRRELRAAYDSNVDIDDLLSRAAAFVSTSPKLGKVLSRRGLGSRPDIVKAIVEHVWQTNWHGRPGRQTASGA